jgi:hypothetical protein
MKPCLCVGEYALWARDEVHEQDSLWLGAYEKPWNGGEAGSLSPADRREVSLATIACLGPPDWGHEG